MRKIFSGALTVAVFAIFLFLLFVALTRAQSAEIIASGGPFAPEEFAATAAGVGGRIATMNRIGVRSMLVTITSTSGEVRSAISSSFGYYSFEDVTAGETYLISVSAKRFASGGPWLETASSRASSFRSCQSGTPSLRQ